MQIRAYTPKDTETLVDLFYRAVHEGAAGYYTPAQLNAWAPEKQDIVARHAQFSSGLTVVAEQDGAILGYALLADGNYLDHLFVHPRHQRKGVATALAAALEHSARVAGQTELTTHASCAAKPFFTARGWRLVKPNTVVANGQALRNYLMEKEL